MTLDFYKMRLASIREASQRSRWVYGASTIAALAQLGATWNAAGSWLRRFALEHSTFPKDDEVVTHLQRALLDRWVDSMFVDVPLLGLHFSISDASLVGSICLLVLSIWLFYCLRRENHLVGQTFRDATGESQETRAYVYYGISGSQVFATSSRNDEPYFSIRASAVRVHVIVGIRAISRVLIYLPVIAIAAMIASDLLALFYLPAIFRVPHTDIWSVMGPEKHLGLIIHVLPMEVIAVVCGISTGLILWLAQRFQNGTGAILREANENAWAVTVPGASSVSTT